jgi:hypothetical protein
VPLPFFLLVFFSSSDSLLDELDDSLLCFLLDFLSLFLTSTFTTSLVTVVTCFDEEDDFSSKLPIGLYCVEDDVYYEPHLVAPGFNDDESDE